MRMQWKIETAVRRFKALLVSLLSAGESKTSSIMTKFNHTDGHYQVMHLYIKAAEDQVFIPTHRGFDVFNHWQEVQAIISSYRHPAIAVACLFHLSSNNFT